MRHGHIPVRTGHRLFVSALVSDVASKTVYTTAVLEELAPAISEAMWRLSPPPTLPESASLVVGRYLDGSVSIAAEGNALVMRLGAESAPLNLTQLVYESTPTRIAFRAAPVHANLGCRWLDDGTDLEIAYFTLPAAKANATALRFMGGLYDRYSGSG